MCDKLLGNQAWDALTAGQVATLRKQLHMQVDQPFSHEGRAPIRSFNLGRVSTKASILGQAEH
jgi:hypothetical protein